MEPQWLDWAKRLQALAQIGLTYTVDVYDRERYEEIRRIAAELMSAGSGQPIEPILQLFAGQDGYATPKIDVRGVVFRDDAILLVKEVADGGWTLPGGWADVCATPSANVEREIWEESGYRARVVKLLAVYDRSCHGHEPPYPFHIYKLFFHCELTGGEATVSHETSGVGFFTLDALPPLSISRVTPKQIARMFAHQAHPEWPTDFD